MRLSDTLLGVVIILFAGVVYFASSTFPAPVLQDFGPGFFPQLLSGLLAAAGLVMTIGGLRRQMPAVALADWWQDRRRRRNVLIVPVAGVFYVVASPWLGFVPSALLLVFTMSVVFGVSVARAALLAIASAAIMHLAFVEFLAVPLPWGLLEPLVFSGGAG